MVALALAAVLTAAAVGDSAGRAAHASPGPGGPVEPLVVGGEALVSLLPVPAGSPFLFAVGERGLYRGTPDGAGWTRVGDAPPEGRVVAAVDDGQILLAGDHPPCARGDAGMVPLHRSADGGATWRPVAGTVGLRPLAVWSGAGIALGAGCAGLAVSGDGGVTWQPVPPTGANLDPTAFAPFADPDRIGGLLAGTGEGGTSRLSMLDLSDPTQPLLGDPLLEFWGLGALAALGETLAVGSAVGVAVSRDDGRTWAASRDGLEAVTVDGDPRTDGLSENELRRPFGILAVALDPLDANRLAVGTVDGLFVSDDGGATWSGAGGIAGGVPVVIGLADGTLLAQTAAGVVRVGLPRSVATPSAERNGTTVRGPMSDPRARHGNRQRGSR